jgi:N,N'-diacetyllegionaminate synthase
MKTKIILEAGVNHNGSIKIAKKLIDCAKESGADYVKFQSFITDELVLPNTKLAKYQKKNLGKKISQYEMLKKLEISKEFTIELIKYCKLKNIKFLSSVFGFKSFKLLNSLGIKEIKVPSGEINNIPLLKYISNFKKKIIISSGMSTFSEVKEAIKILTSNKINKKDIVLLHCNTDYPTKLSDINLNAMVDMGKKLKIKYGYSDHSESLLVPIIASAMGATLIEKHITISKKKSGPDHKASLEVKDINTLVSNIKKVNLIKGLSQKIVTKSEKKKYQNCEKVNLCESIY